MRKILFRGYFGHGNWGDEILLRALIHGLITNGLQRERLHYWQGPDTAFQHASIEHSIARSLQGMAAWLQSGAMVFSGGIFYDHLPDLNTRRLRRMLQLARINRLFGKKVVMLGVSIGPLITSEGRRLARNILELAEIIWVRDRQSYLFCRKAGLTCGQMPDLSAALYSELAVTEAVSGNGGILYIPCASGMNCRTHVRTINALIAAVKPWGRNIRLLPIHMSADMGMAFRLADQMGLEVTRQPSADPMALFSTLKGAELIVSTRLHGGWAAYLLGRPFLQIDYHDKCRGFAENIGLPSECLIDPFAETVNLDAGIRRWFEADNDLFNELTPQRVLERQAMRALTAVGNKLRHCSDRKSSQ